MECQGTRVDGEPCGSVIVGESGYCYSHDPDLAEHRKSARERGGANSSNVARLKRHLGPSSLGPVFGLLETALTQTHVGALSPARASAMASLARAMVSVLEAGELEERLETLESRLSA